MRKSIPEKRFKSTVPEDLGFFENKYLHKHFLPRILMLLDRQSWGRAARVCGFWYNAANSPAVLEAVGISQNRWIAKKCQNRFDIFFGFNNSERARFIRFLMDSEISSETKINFLEQIINSLGTHSSKKSAVVEQFLMELGIFIRSCAPKTQLETIEQKLKQENVEAYVSRFLKEQTLTSAVRAGVDAMEYIIFTPLLLLWLFNHFFKETQIKLGAPVYYYLIACLLMIAVPKAGATYHYFREEYKHGGSDREIDEQLKLEEELNSNNAPIPK